MKRYPKELKHKYEYMVYHKNKLPHVDRTNRPESLFDNKLGCPTYFKESLLKGHLCHRDEDQSHLLAR